jgi:hypothetical protein
MKLVKIALSLVIVSLITYSCTVPTEQETSQTDSISVHATDSANQSIDTSVHVIDITSVDSIK